MVAITCVFILFLFGMFVILKVMQNVSAYDRISQDRAFYEAHHGFRHKVAVIPAKTPLQKMGYARNWEQPNYPPTVKKVSTKFTRTLPPMKLLR
jgi:hypothetical protein